MSSRSALSPFHHRAFAVLWFATVVSNIGTWMHDVGAAWLMTELAPSPFMVAAVQAATTLPVFLFALLAGAIADIVDRRMLLIQINVVMGIGALIMTGLVYAGSMTPTLLLLFTFLFGTGAAFMAPAWQAIVPKLVPREELSSAIALNSMGINVSRAIGPALAGLLIVAIGIAVPFFVNALSVIGIVTALLWWKPEPSVRSKLAPEPIGSAIATGVRFAIHCSPLKMTLIRAVSFFLFASAFWALLPLIAREVLAGGPAIYGILMASVGAGAVTGAFVLPNVKKQLGADRTVAGGTLGTVLVLLVLATVQNQILAVLVSALAGFSWIAVLSSLNVSAQTALPDWVRARGLSIYLTVFFGAMSLGSLVWGQIATLTGIPVALVLAATGALAGLFLSRKAKLNKGDRLDLTPSMHWPEPLITGDVDHDRGPVMITIDYSIDPVDQNAFLAAIYSFAEQRRRDGAFDWGIMQDSTEAGHFVEYFMVGSWREHLRQHERVTKADQEQQALVNVFHRGNEPPQVRHLIAITKK